MTNRAAVLALAGTLCLAVAIVGVLSALRPQTPAAASSDPETFEGRWSAVGRRQTLPTEGDRVASIVEVSGAVVLARGTRFSRGFRGEAIAFDDGRSIGAGRAVWTDAEGDRVFSRLTGLQLQTGRRIRGTITGGTGRYAGLRGAYELTWQYVSEGEGGVVQGRAADLNGVFAWGDEQP